MKKLLNFLFVLTLLLSGCSSDIVDPVLERNDNPTPIPIQPFSTEKTEIPLPTAAPDLSEDPFNIVSLVLSDYGVVFTEDYNDIVENNASGFSGIKRKSISEDNKSFMFLSGDDQVVFSLTTEIGDFEPSESGKNQAIMIKFMLSKCNSAEFIIDGINQHEIRFDYGGDPFLGNETSFYGTYPSPFRMEADKWHYILLAVDKASNLRCEIWEEGHEDEISYYGCGYDRGGEITKADDQSWELKILLDGDEWIKLEQYWIMEFEEYVK